VRVHARSARSGRHESWSYDQERRKGTEGEIEHSNLAGYSTSPNLNGGVDGGGVINLQKKAIGADFPKIPEQSPVNTSLIGPIGSNLLQKCARLRCFCGGEDRCVTNANTRGGRKSLIPSVDTDLALRALRGFGCKLAIVSNTPWG